ncbi:hypothetical protein ATE84_0859 [Aquimarina sp. MAR_2010_214]|nr:hypothetical protein ATE84_0859 [Aquimarina sp. MAR_2010_214]
MDVENVTQNKNLWQELNLEQINENLNFKNRKEFSKL